MAISTKEDLDLLLHRGWEIEKNFESLAAWKGFISVDSNHRETVLTLARESNAHRLSIEKMLKVLNLKAPTSEIPAEIFDFEGMLDEEILKKTIEQDEVARDLYTNIVENTDPKLISALSGEKDVDFFYQTLKCMIGDEKRHISMVEKISGKIDRIQ